MISPRPPGGPARDLPLPPLPLSSLQGGETAALPDVPELVERTVTLGDLLDGAVAGVVTSACRIPDGPGGLLVERAVGMGDRRDVMLHAEQPLRRLAAGTEVVAPDARTEALLRAHHRSLVPVRGGGVGSGGSQDESSGESALEIRPLWRDPSIESVGELLEPDSWLPEPGQGVAVLLHTPAAAHYFRGVGVDPGAAAVLRAERAVGRAFPFAVPLVRAQLFGEWLSVHGVILAPDGDRVVRARVRGDREDPVGVAERLVEILMARGGALLRPPEWTGDGAFSVAAP